MQTCIHCLHIRTVRAALDALFMFKDDTIDKKTLRAYCEENITHLETEVSTTRPNMHELVPRPCHLIDRIFVPPVVVDVACVQSVSRKAADALLQAIEQNLPIDTSWIEYFNQTLCLALPHRRCIEPETGFHDELPFVPKPNDLTADMVYYFLQLTSDNANVVVNNSVATVLKENNVNIDLERKVMTFSSTITVINDEYEYDTRIDFPEMSRASATNIYALFTMFNVIDKYQQRVDGGQMSHQEMDAKLEVMETRMFSSAEHIEDFKHYMFMPLRITSEKLNSYVLIIENTRARISNIMTAIRDITKTLRTWVSKPHSETPYNAFRTRLESIKKNFITDATYDISVMGPTSMRADELLPEDAIPFPPCNLTPFAKHSQTVIKYSALMYEAARVACLLYDVAVFSAARCAQLAHTLFSATQPYCAFNGHVARALAFRIMASVHIYIFDFTANPSVEKDYATAVSRMLHHQKGSDFNRWFCSHIRRLIDERWAACVAPKRSRCIANAFMHRFVHDSKRITELRNSRAHSKACQNGTTFAASCFACRALRRYTEGGAWGICIFKLLRDGDFNKFDNVHTFGLSTSTQHTDSTPRATAKLRISMNANNRAASMDTDDLLPSPDTDSDSEYTDDEL